MLGDVLDVMSLTMSAISFCFLAAPSRRFFGLSAIAEGLGSMGSALHREPVMASILAGICALAAWLWWNAGGGDGTKRRLRALGRAFKGVRRTAPVAGGAS